MLEKPDISDQSIIARLQEAYGLEVQRLAFLPLGADVNTAVYRVDADFAVTYFLKLRKGDFDEISLDVPMFLNAQGIRAVIAPRQTRAGQTSTRLDPFRMMLYPYIAGQDGYQVALSDEQWLDFGAALGSIHTVKVPAALAGRIPRETYSAQWRAMVKTIQAQVEHTSYPEPVAARVADFLRAQRATIQQLVQRAETLAAALQASPPELVLCHSDLHAGNLLIPTSAAGGLSPLYIVDWDNPTFAAKERDLAMIGGSFAWNNPREVAVFYQGYGFGRPVAIDAPALSYYRCERVVQDIAAFCQELLCSDEGGQDREQSYQYLTGSFLPGHEVDLALEKDRP